MLPVGIDALRFYVPSFSIRLADLAKARNIDPQKYHIGLGQETMAILPPDEDIVTMGANAARFLTETDKNKISLLLFATESSIDQSKAAGLYVHRLLELPSTCRVVEIKQACYSATCALQLAVSYLRDRPDEKVLLIASDNARYGLHTPGEPTQGCGAAAILLSANPRLVTVDPEQGIYAEDTMDFWRPNYMSEALVDGKYSTKVYIHTLIETWKEYAQRSQRTFADHARFCYHLPFTRMAIKAHERLAKYVGASLSENLISSGLTFAKQTGNAYTAALYIGLTSLLENDTEDLSEQRVGLFSYGSGSVGEFFSAKIQKNYSIYTNKDFHTKILSSREYLSCEEYEKFFSYQLPVDGSNHLTPSCSSHGFRLLGIDGHKRLYG